MNYMYLWQHYFIFWYYVTELVEAHVPYKTIMLEDPDVCSEITRRGVKFEPASAINLTQSRLSDHSLRWATSVNCNFRLKPKNKRDGIMVVIQELSFRRDDSTQECIDYIQFKPERGRPSPKICGYLSARSVMSSQLDVFDTTSKDNTFISNDGDLDVSVYISKNALKPDETTRINIIFTLYNYCLYSPNDYIPCLESREYCIHKDYFFDGVINCPFFGCIDENGCNEVLVTSNSVGNKVLIGSATTLVFTFMVFIVCLYICRKQRKFCWSDNFASPNTTTQTQTTRVIEMNESPIQPANATPSQSNDQEDKDLPPSYESLFPSRQKYFSCFLLQNTYIKAAAKIKLDYVETAIDDCTKAIDLNPDYVKAYLRRAKLYEKSEKLDESLKDFTKILDLEPANNEARAAAIRLPPMINERNEKLKEEMMGKLKDLGNLVLRPFGLSTENFKLQQDPNTGGYSVNFQQNHKR
ncbi:hypothetical protein Trydic_g11216 [Trypoxylus dichotomus]